MEITLLVTESIGMTSRERKSIWRKSEEGSIDGKILEETAMKGKDIES